MRHCDMQTAELSLQDSARSRDNLYSSALKNNANRLNKNSHSTESAEFFPHLRI